MKTSLLEITRREFLGSAASAGIAAALSGACEAAYVADDLLECDVLVYGATPGGIAAAVAAAREGRTVMLADHEDHIGGIVSNGLTNADIGKKQAVGGLFYEFTRRVVKYYQAQDEVNSSLDNVKLCRDGYYYEAGAAEQIFHSMLAGQGSRILLRLRHELKQTIVKDGRLQSVVLEQLFAPTRSIKVAAPVFIDATYEGDLAAMAGVPYRVGRESRAEYSEPHAGRVYAHFSHHELLPGSTGEADDAIQAFCFRLHVTKDPAKRVTIEKPAGYRRDDYLFTLDDMKAGRATKLRQIIQIYPMPNGRFELNSNHCDPKTGVPAQSFDLAEECWAWPEASPKERRKIYERYLSHNVGLLWFLQNDPEVPADIRNEANQFGWHRDEWPQNGNVPRQVYVRQGRRILGDYLLTEHDGEVDPQTERTKVQPTSIAVLEFAFDSHACHKYDPDHPGVREGYVYIEHEPLQLPYGVLAPKKIEGLLVPVACSASHVGYNALRMEPVFMALGEVCGIAANIAIDRKLAVRSVPVGELQHRLVEHGGVITFYSDLKFDDPAFAAFQWLGARGLNPGYKATPKLELSRQDGWNKLQRILSFEQIAWQPPTENPDKPLTGVDLAQWLSQAGHESKPATPAGPADQPLNLTQFCTTVYSALTRSHA